MVDHTCIKHSEDMQYLFQYIFLTMSNWAMKRGQVAGVINKAIYFENTFNDLENWE